MDDKSPTEADKVSKFDADGKIRRGATIGSAKKVSLAEAMKSPINMAAHRFLSKA